MTDSEQLKTTPLDALHRELGAKMVPFAGYAMPVQYPTGILTEHLHTRKAAGLFDVSHMGQVRLVGVGAIAAIRKAVAGRPPRQLPVVAPHTRLAGLEPMALGR